MFSEVEICDSRPCQNDGVCSQKEGKYACACTPGYGGLNCDKGGLFSYIYIANITTVLCSCKTCCLDIMVLQWQLQVLYLV